MTLKENAHLPRNAKNFLISNLQIVVIIVLPLLFGLFKGNFLSLVNLNNVLDLSSVLMISALGFTFVMETGAIDLSVEGNMALSGIIAATLMKNNLGIFAILAAMIIASCFGFVNGIIHTKLRIPSFMTTLGMLYITNGISTVITQGQYITIGDQSLRKIAIGRIGGVEGIIPITLVIALLVAVIMTFLSEKMKYGRYVLAVGGDELIARDLGVNINRTKIKSFTIAGATYGLAGAILALKLGAGDTFSAYGYTFETISACVIGGIAISGGIGKIYKSLLGAIIITIFRTGMVFFLIKSNVQAGILGLVIIVTVALTIDRSKIGTIR